MEVKNVVDNSNKSKNEILIRYKIYENENPIHIFGYHFFKDNKDKCKYIYEGKEYPLDYEFYLGNKKTSKDILEIKLTGIKNITNINYLFDLCQNLISVPDISERDTPNITEMYFGFNECRSLITLPDISKWNTSKVTNMNGLFSGCWSLLSLPDISKWDTSNVTEICSMFNGYKSLVSLPDISKQITSNNENICSIFKDCSSLISMPDISKWDLSNVEYMGLSSDYGVFY